MKGNTIVLLCLLASVLPTFGQESESDPIVLDSVHWIEFRNWKIQRTWNATNTDILTFSKNVIRRLFRDHSEIVPKDTNQFVFVLQHTSTVFGILQYILDITAENKTSYNEPDFVEIARYYKRMGYTAQYFNDLRLAILEELHNSLENKFSSTDDIIWMHILRKIWKLIINEFDTEESI